VCKPSEGRAVAMELELELVPAISVQWIAVESEM
jgi:hypothetical protein